MLETYGLILGFFITAGLYSAVGHAGASAYLALMALANFAPDEMKPIALILNCFVALVASFRYRKFLNLKLIIILMMSSMPMAFLGGKIYLSPEIYKPLLAFGLFFACWRMLNQKISYKNNAIKNYNIYILVLLSMTIGFLSGLTGIGGGIFLSPVLLLTHWATVRTTSATSSVFILVNSIAGLIGFFTTHSDVHLSSSMPLWILAVLIGGFLGTKWGLKSPSDYVVKLLGSLLGLAGLKLLI